MWYGLVLGGLLAYSWEDHGKIPGSHGHQEGDRPGDGPVERKAAKKQGVAGNSVPQQPEGLGLSPEGTREPWES